MNPISACRHFVLMFVLICVTSSVSLAGSLTPNPANGNPYSVGPLNNYTVTLTPDPALYRSPAVGCTWLLPAAQAAV